VRNARKWEFPGKITSSIMIVLCATAFLAVRWKTTQSSGEGVLFREVSRKAGVSFVHTKPLFDSKLDNIMPWMTAVGASASAADYENSGHVGVFLTNSGHGSHNALLRNEGTVGGVPQFRDVAAEVGLADLNQDGSCMAAAWGDYDNDGFPDLYIVREGASNLLFHNVPMLDDRGRQVLDSSGVPRRTFVNVTGPAGVGYAGHGVGALWFDFDHDGKLDLLVANYFPAHYLNPNHAETPERLDLWHVKETSFMAESFNDARNGGGVLLYHNDGNGQFSEIHKSVGLTYTGWALSVGTADLTNDGWQDIYVANDFGADDLYINVAGGPYGRTFVRVEGGITADKIGRDTKKGMNVDFGDFDHSGYLSIYVTNIVRPRILPEGNMLWVGRNDPVRPGRRNFTDAAEQLGVHDCGWGWGAKFVDVNNDGWLDLFVLNGFVSANPKKSYWYELQNMVSDYRTIIADSKNWPPMEDKSLSGYQKSCLFVQGSGRFHDVAESAGITDEYDGRGVAIADFNNDGATDFFVSNQGQPALLYLNELYHVCRPGMCPHWIGLALHGNGTSSNRDAIGARVVLETTAGTQMSEVSRGNGFASQSDPRVRFGLGTAIAIKQASVFWPDGQVQRLGNLKLDTYNEITE
jgi:enediyne biosynthesis protein E4